MQLALGLTPQSEYEDNIRLISKELAGACALLCTDTPVSEVRKNACCSWSKFSYELSHVRNAVSFIEYCKHERHAVFTAYFHVQNPIWFLRSLVST